MRNLLDEIPSILLMGPGPSSVSPSTYQALSKPTLGHLDPFFINIMDEVKTGLQTLFNTKNPVTLPVSGTGSAGMETSFVNMIELGDKVLVLQNGVFGQRMVDVATRLGAVVTELSFTWGTPVDVNQVEEQLKKDDYKIVAMVHAETSTGVLNPVSEISELLKGKDSLFLVDTVTSLGGIPVEIDKWDADIVYSGTQKCLSCPPGLSPATFSPAAVEALKNRKSKVPNWYLDVSMVTKYWEGKTRAYHHTAPINMLYGLYQAIWNVLDEGLDHVYARHQEAHEHLVTGLADIGWQMMVKEGYRLPMLNTALVPKGIDEALLRHRLLTEHHIEIGAGLGPMAGKIIRIGLMGYNAQISTVDRFLTAIREVLAK